MRAVFAAALLAFVLVSCLLSPQGRGQAPARSILFVCDPADASSLVEDRLFFLLRSWSVVPEGVEVVTRFYGDPPARAACNRSGIFRNSLPFLGVVETGKDGAWNVLWKTKADSPRRAAAELLGFLRPGVAPPARGEGLVFMARNARGFDEYLNERDDSVLIRIPGSGFVMGSCDGRGRADERPAHAVRLGGYCIGKYEVTNEQYGSFVRQTGYKAVGRWKRYALPGCALHPVTDLTWEDAERYCRWAGLRLPTEAEWERAARGTDGREFPWGNAWEKNNCNNRTMDRTSLCVLLAPMDEYRGTVPSGILRDGASPCGALDMSGNAWEWCRDWYDESYYARSPRENPVNDVRSFSRVWRGGSWVCGALDYFRCASRGRLAPVNQFYASGSGVRVCGDVSVQVARPANAGAMARSQGKSQAKPSRSGARPCKGRVLATVQGLRPPGRKGP